MSRDIGVLAPKKGYAVNLELKTPRDLWSDAGWVCRREDWTQERIEAIEAAGVLSNEFRHWYSTRRETVNFQFKRKKHAVYFKLMWGGHI